MKKLVVPAALAACLAPVAALAHPGHEAAAREGALHWLTQADHLVVGLALGVAVTLAVFPGAGEALRSLFRRKD